jgi:CHAT domain-containing protein/Tfp pilus assembly protein PilF
MTLRPWLLGGLLALLALPARAGETPLADDFAVDSLKSYEAVGKVAWQKGRVLLGPGSALVRPVSLGHFIDIRAVFRVPAGKGNYQAVVRAQGERAGSEVALVVVNGTLNLGNLPRPEQLIPLQKPGPDGRPADQDWVVQLQMRHGLARARAWRLGTEPPPWMTAHYCNDPRWQLRKLAIWTGGASAVLTSLRLSGSPATDKLPPAVSKKLDQATEEIRAAKKWLGEGRPREALVHARTALRLREDVYGSDHPLAAEIATLTGKALWGAGEHEAARSLLERVLKTRRLALGPDDPRTAETHTNLGVVLYELGEYAVARPHYERALAINSKQYGEQHEATAADLNNLACLLRATADYAGARRMHERALATRRKLLGEDHPHTALSMSNLGLVLGELGDETAARRLLEQAVAICKKTLPPEHPTSLTALNGLSVRLQDMGEYAEALPLAEQVVAINKRAVGSHHPRTGTSLLNLGAVLTGLGKYPRAHTCYQEALVIHRKALGPDHPITLGCLNNLGHLAWTQGKYDEAADYFEQAHTALERTLGQDHPQVAAARSNLGLQAQARGRAAEAWRHHAAAGAAYARLAERLLLASAESAHAAIVQRWGYCLDALLTIAEAAPGQVEAAGSELLAAVLDWKASSGRALTLRQEARVLAGDATATALHRKLNELRGRLVRLMLRGPGRATVAEHRRALAELRTERDTLERELGERVAGFASLRRAGRAGADELAGMLGRGAMLVELVLYHPLDARRTDARQWGAPRYAAVLVWREPGKKVVPVVRLVPLGEAARLDPAVSAWREAVQKGAIPRAVEDALRERLWTPIAKALPAQARRLYIAPDGALALVPFEALRAKDGTYLVERFAMSYLSSGRDLVIPSARAGKVGPALVLADPDYDGLGKPTGGVSVRGPQRRSADLEKRSGPFRSLPGFAREADAVARLLNAAGSEWKVQVQRGPDASEDALAARPRPRLLYLITHGFFLADQDRKPKRRAGLRDLELVDASPGIRSLPAPGEDPRLRSGLALAGANRWQERSAKGLSDGLLTALEVEGLDLWGTELVVLSACETGLGEVQVGEGVLGLRRAFQLAGAQTVVASLWKVPDAETEQLMARFLKGWLKGQGKAEALRQAQLDLIRALRASPSAARRQAPPLYWAAFVCHGAAE